MIVTTKVPRAAMIARLLHRLGGLALLVAASSAPAAVIVIGNSSSTVYGVGFTGAGSIFTAQTRTIRQAGGLGGFPAEYGLDFTTSSSNSTFSFLQDQYCVGKCVTFAVTTVTLTLSNAGTAAEAMRFDSQITPGHLARLGSNTPASATFQAVFDFDVTQTTGGTTRTLYSADGQADSTGTEITTSDGSVFNGLTRSQFGSDYNVLDWSATNINLLLDSLQPGETSTLTYQSRTVTSTGASKCTDITTCAGVQVVFGDPRNNGGGANRQAGGAAPVPVIGGGYGASTIAFDIVSVDTPLPPPPPIFTPPVYDPRFVSLADPPAVPEPAVWLLMIAGFGLVGAAMRRRGAVLPSAG